MLIADFLPVLFGNIKAPNRILIWRVRNYNGEVFNKESHWFSSAHEASMFATGPECQGCDVYFGIGISHKDYGGYNLCPEDKVEGMTGFWIEFDIKGVNHADKNLPPNEAAVHALLAEFPLQPSFLVRSGGGMYAGWQFTKPWMLKDEYQRILERQAASAFADTFRVSAKRHGFKVDNEYDLTRLLLVPGTFDHKTNPAKPVELIMASGKVYQPSEFEKYFISMNDAEPGLFAEPCNQVVYKVAVLLLSPRAQPPNMILAALENSEKLKNYWEQKRNDLVDDDPRSYDLSFAARAVGYNLTDQEIVDLLLARRRKHGDDIRLYDMDYYVSIIKRIRQDGWRAVAVENLKQLLEENVSKELRIDVRLRALENLRISLGLEITRIVKYNSDTPRYEIFTPLGNILLKSTEHLVTERLFKIAVAESQMGIMLPDMATEWVIIVNAILKACEVINCTR
ncbi:MAG: hypothetical protein WCJ56_00985 [bacterium]